MARESITADAILNRVRGLRAGAQAPHSAEGYRQAAAVLAAIANPAQLRPTVGSFEPGVGERALRSELVAAPRRLGGDVMLNADSRRAALRALGSRERMLKALEVNPIERTGIVQTQFEKYIAGTAKPLIEQTDEELEATLQVLLWLQDLLPDLPAITEVRRLVAWRGFMAPFEHLAGDAIFRGRVSELEELRNFVGVLAPETLRGRLARAISQFTPPSHRVLSMFGPGGVGKSALVARFILEHSRLPLDLRIPIAYLDFDRSTLSVTEHRTLAEEILSQLLLQFPDEPEFQNLRTLLPSLSEADLENATTSVRAFNFEPTLNEFIRVVQRQLPNRPFLIVLDTFEQVQYQGETHALRLWQALGKVQERFPMLRIIVAGRAPVATLRMGGELPKPLEIGDLDPAAALAFVKASSDLPDDTARAIVRAVGGVPLSLKLAARLLRDQPNADIDVGSRLWLRTADEVIQGQLFDRILGQIGDLQVRRVAHPGLVLRRLTPDILLNVLREPCGLAISSDADAAALFTKLQAEVSLVATASEGDGALIHRRELREVMLRLLKQRSPAVVADISQRAVEYYRHQPGTRARIEQTYHELLLRRPINKAVFDDREVRASIQASLSELPIESQRLLASFGFQVDAPILEKATVEERESAVAEFVEQMLPHRHEGFAQARARLEGMGSIDHDSPLWRAEARLRYETHDADGAAEALAKGLRFAIEAGNSFRVLELLTDQAWQAERESKIGRPAETLERLADYAARHDDAAAKLQWFLQSGRVSGHWIDATHPPAAVERLFNRIRPRDLFGLAPVTRGFWVAARAAGMRGRFFAELVLNSEANFESVTFADNVEAQRALQAMLRRAYAVLVQSDSDADWTEFALSLEGLIGAWPYRNLHVHPPATHTRQFAV